MDSVLAGAYLDIKLNTSGTGIQIGIDLYQLLSLMLIINHLFPHYLVAPLSYDLQDKLEFDCLYI